jgi:hypothetical protein
MKTSRTGSLGLAVLAALAIGTVAASAAQAGQFTAGAYPATVTGEKVGVHLLETEIGVMECGQKLDGELAAAAETLTLTPEYGTSCTINGKEVHFNAHGCDFVFHADETVVMDQVEGSLDVKCPAEQMMDFEITSMPICHLLIPEQAGLSQLTYTDRTMAKDVDVDFAIEGLAYGLSPNCAVSGTFANGSYTGTSTLKADNMGMGTPFTVD